jgi:oxygen-dependent protoporphyrinogen oxidase
MPPQHVAVLGAGITGLSSAFHLARTFPRTKITLLEERPRVGGWINSQRIKLLDGRSVLLEAGPRTLRPNSKALLELVRLNSVRSSTTHVNNAY